MPQPDDREWLEADGLGGFAMGPVSGPRTRRYHALLLAAARPPAGRVVLVNGIESFAETNGVATALSTQRYAPDVIYPDGAASMIGFAPDPWPTWTYRLADGRTLTHDLFVAADSCDTVMRWRVSAGDASCRLDVRPLLSGRDFHGLHRENPQFDFTAHLWASNVSWRPYPGLPAVAALTNGAYRHDPEWFRNFLYSVERDRGMDDVEDLASPGVFTWDLAHGEAVLVLREGDTLAVRAESYAAHLAAVETARRAACPTPLDRAADAYLVDRGAGRTILAGFPWFGDWGRDTFIAMRGLLIARGRLAEAAQILLAWAAVLDQGMLPNRFLDAGDAAEFNSVDASLWFIVAGRDFLAAAMAEGHPVAASTTDTLFAAFDAILGAYRHGARYGISMDETDGLLRAGVPGVQLTWMDAKVGDTVITPRIGKPVEVQALWINALHIASARNPAWAEIEAKARASFAARFWNPAANGLFDVIDADHHPGADDPKIRPNQIFAVGGLPFPLLDGERARAVVDLVETRLLTPMGPRSLDPADPAYCPRYEGDVWHRDSAYHQGTVWPWLTGPFVEAWLRVHASDPGAGATARTRFLDPLRAHLAVAGVGHISEIADAEPPHTPRGCPFQAWSLGEYLRAERLIDAFAPAPAAPISPPTSGGTR